MGYSEALEQQAGLYARYDSAEREHHGLRDLGASMFNGNLDAGRTFTAMAILPLRYGETFYWSPQLCNLLEGTAPSLSEWHCDPGILLAPWGFCWFAKPLLLPIDPILGGKGAVRAFGWGPITSLENQGVMIPVTGSTPSNMDGMFTFFYVEENGVILPNAAYPCRSGQSIFDTTNMVNMQALNDRSRRKLQYVASAVNLIAQRIIVAPVHRAERHAVKRLERDGWTHEPLIRVVELRRKASQSKTSDDPKTVAWTHQWVVSGHWRQQPYPSLGIVQPRWIMPHVKGPDNLPLKPPRAKVFAVVR